MNRSVASLIAFLLSLAATAPAAATPNGCTRPMERVGRGTWETVEVQGIDAPSEASVAVDPHDPRFVIVADLSGVLVTSDGGCTWTRAARYSDFLSPLLGYTVDAAVAGSGTGRSLHVLVAPWGPFIGYLEPVLLSSADDGATWTETGLPPGSGPASYATYALEPASRSSGTLYLLVVRSAVSAVHALDGAAWRWLSLGTWVQPATCAPGGPCPARTLQTLHADERRRGWWALTAGGPDGEALARSEDEGASWDHRPVPGLVGGVAQMDVARDGVILLLGDFGDYAISRDGARSWSVGDLPEIASSASTSIGVSAVAHFDRGRAFAATLGITQTSEWAGNVFVFDGRRWRDVSPAAYAGYDRTDEDGRRRTFVDLTGTSGPLVALTSTGDLMTYRR